MPSEIRFAVIKKQLEASGWVLSRISGSHHIFTKPGEELISIPVHHNKVKPRYVREVENKLKSG